MSQYLSLFITVLFYVGGSQILYHSGLNPDSNLGLLGRFFIVMSGVSVIFNIRLKDN